MKNILEVLAEIVISVLMIKPMFQLSVLTGIGYLIAIAGAVKDGSLFKKRNVARLIVGGTLLSYIAGMIFMTGTKANDTISFVIILILAAYVWIKGYFMKKGIAIK